MDIRRFGRLYKTLAESYSLYIVGLHRIFNSKQQNGGHSIEILFYHGWPVSIFLQQSYLYTNHQIINKHWAFFAKQKGKKACWGSKIIECPMPKAHDIFIFCDEIAGAWSAPDFNYT